MLKLTEVGNYIMQYYYCQDKRKYLNVKLFLEITLRHQGLKSIREKIRYVDNRMMVRSIGKLRQLQKLQELNGPFISKMAKGECVKLQ